MFRDRRDGAEQPVSLAVGTGREVKRVGIGVPAAAQRQCPQPVDLDLFAIVVPEDTEEIPV